MSQGPIFPYEVALPIAEKIKAALAEFCEQIEIAGSLRRKRGQVSDIDLVLLPLERADGPLRRRARENANELKNGGDIMQLELRNGMQVDLYFARRPENDLAGYAPGNWGVRLLAMTGSKEHNVKLARMAKEKGMHFAPYDGLMDGGKYVDLPADPKTGAPRDYYQGGRVVATETETEIFRLLGLPWIPPEEREA